MTLFLLLACTAVIIILYRPPTKLVMFSFFWNTVGKRPVRILVECFLVYPFFILEMGGGSSKPAISNQYSKIRIMPVCIPICIFYNDTLLLHEQILEHCQFILKSSDKKRNPSTKWCNILAKVSFFINFWLKI